MIPVLHQSGTRDAHIWCCVTRDAHICGSLYSRPMWYLTRTLLEFGEDLDSRSFVTQRGRIFPDLSHVFTTESLTNIHSGRETGSNGNLVNVAIDGKATQDSTSLAGVASRAIDGNTEGDYFAGESCSHNGVVDNGWWEVELAEPTNVKRIVVYNRLCFGRRAPFTNVKGGLRCASTSNYANASTVRIESTSGSYLSLCEVEVQSDKNFQGEDGLVNLALNKPTSQSSTGWGGDSSRAVDGRRNKNWDQGSCTCTGTSTDSSWQVDLEDNYNVKKITVVNRADAARQRIDGAQVEFLFSCSL
eukprot:sb/3467312/